VSVPSGGAAVVEFKLVPILGEVTVRSTPCGCTGLRGRRGARCSRQTLQLPATAQVLEVRKRAT